jgi:AraC-like DNA-binding protein/molybdopterin-binding protein
VLGKILSGMRIFFIVALSTVIAATAAVGESAASAAADSGSAKTVVDSAKTKSNVVTSAVTDTAKQDSALAHGKDTSAVSQSADTVAVADTSIADTSKNDALAIDTLAISDTMATVSGDTDTVNITTDNDSLLVPEEKEKKPLFADSKLFKWIAANIFYIIFFGISILLIAATFYYFVTRKDARRFLTTTRLSVLDKMVQKACRYIESNYADQNLSVDAVARELITGAAYLDALFVKEIGIGVHDFIAQVRVNAIKNILAENPDTNIEDACSRSGFKDKSEAERYFKSLCKVEIWEYVKSLKKY